MGAEAHPSALRNAELDEGDGAMGHQDAATLDVGQRQDAVNIGKRLGNRRLDSLATLDLEYNLTRGVSDCDADLHEDLPFPR